MEILSKRFLRIALIAGIPLGFTVGYYLPSRATVSAAGEVTATPEIQELLAPQLGDVIVKTSLSPTGVAIIQAERDNTVVWGRESDLTLPAWDQRLSKDGRLWFWANNADIVSAPIDGSGGPGTAAKAEDRMQFAGPLAIGGFGLYGAAVQTNPAESKVLLYEAYGNSHHQTTIHTTPSPIHWLGWAGKQGSFLYIVQGDEDGKHLYRLVPTFPDPAQANRDCYYSTNQLTDCMLRATKETPRIAVRVLDDVRGIFVTSGTPSSQNIQ